MRISELTRDQLSVSIPLLQELDRERIPEDPVLPTGAYVRRLTALPPDARQWFWAARDGAGSVIGAAFLQVSDRENPQLGFAGAMVAPAARRHGIGRDLLREVLARAAAENRTLLAAQTSDRVPSGEAFARAMGAAPGLEMHTNQLDVMAVDAAAVRRAIDTAGAKAAGYRLEWIDCAAADDATLARVAQAYEAINDMPKGELAFEMEHWDADRVRKRSRFFTAMGIEVWTVVAVHAESGAAAGFTEVNFTAERPEVIQQQGTAVAPAHRGHAIGLWLKATVLERIMRERPKSRFIRTGNAKVNEAMLRINTELGFRPAWSETFWQAEAATIGQHLR